MNIVFNIMGGLSSKNSSWVYTSKTKVIHCLKPQHIWKRKLSVFVLFLLIAIMSLGTTTWGTVVMATITFTSQLCKVHCCFCQSNEKKPPHLTICDITANHSVLPGLWSMHTHKLILYMLQVLKCRFKKNVNLLSDTYLCIPVPCLLATILTVPDLCNAVLLAAAWPHLFPALVLLWPNLFPALLCFRQLTWLHLFTDILTYWQLHWLHLFPAMPTF